MLNLRSSNSKVTAVLGGGPPMPPQQGDSDSDLQVHCYSTITRLWAEILSWSHLIKAASGLPAQELDPDGRANPTHRPASDGTRKMETLVNTNSFPAIFKTHVKRAKSQELSQSSRLWFQPITYCAGWGWHRLQNYQVRSAWFSYKGLITESAFSQGSGKAVGHY